MINKNEIIHTNISYDLANFLGLVTIMLVCLIIVAIYVIITIFKDNQNTELSQAINIDFEDINKAVLSQNLEIQKDLDSKQHQIEFLQQKLIQTQNDKIQDIPDANISGGFDSKKFLKFGLIFLAVGIIVTLIVLMLMNPFAETENLLEMIKYVF